MYGTNFLIQRDDSSKALNITYFLKLTYLLAEKVDWTTTIKNIIRFLSDLLDKWKLNQVKLKFILRKHMKDYFLPDGNGYLTTSIWIEGSKNPLDFIREVSWIHNIQVWCKVVSLVLHLEWLSHFYINWKMIRM